MSLDRTVALKIPPEGIGDSGFYWISIGTSTAPGGFTTVILWRMMPAEVLDKWRWYFDYRAALLKVQNPRLYIEIRHGREDLKAVDPIAHERLMLSRKIKSCKAKITEWTNKLQRAVADFKERSPMFPMENEPGYAAALAKVEAKKVELVTLHTRYQEIS